MKKLKTKTFSTIVLSLVCAMMLLVNTASAQDATTAAMKATPEQRAKFQTAMLKNKLQLDSGQTVQLQAINLKYAQKMEPLLNSDEGKLRKLRQMKAIQDAKEGELKKLFTADQFKQYKEAEAEMKEKLKEKKGMGN